MPRSAPAPVLVMAALSELSGASIETFPFRFLQTAPSAPDGALGQHVRRSRAVSVGKSPFLRLAQARETDRRVKKRLTLVPSGSKYGK